MGKVGCLRCASEGISSVSLQRDFLQIVQITYSALSYTQQLGSESGCCARFITPDRKLFALPENFEDFLSGVMNLKEETS